MKVLFAVHDEKVSLSIVKKYQREYKEIISYKNVYYFNAILKELQRDKTYDRVVIDEELEEFTSTSYEEKDKFIFNKLDSITDEASNSKGKDIPIILICSERRTKSEEILVKLFGIGIYNAIIGNDRSIDEVCRRINQPRSKKEAKLYYKIDSNDVDYDPERENDVSEEEMQHILSYFKRLGKNEEKYVEGFRKIVSQYNEEQLKVIMAILPLHVKSVLEEVSPEYQRLVAKSGGRIESRPTQNISIPKPTSEKLLDSRGTTEKTNASPIVIPSSLDKNLIKKVTIKKPAAIRVSEPIEEYDDDLEDEEESVEEVQIKETPRRRGRPSKKDLQERQEVEEEPKKKRRGRPPKKQIEEESQEMSEFSDILPGFEKIEENPEFETIDESLLRPEPISESSLPELDEDYEEENEFDSLPGLYDDEEENDSLLEVTKEEEEYEADNSLPGLEDEEKYNYEESVSSTLRKDTNVWDDDTTTGMQTYEQDYDDYDYTNYNNLLSSDRKVIAFVGTSKNGTSFIINNVARVLAESGIDTAILDATQNKNSYYIYNNNDDELRMEASNSIENLIRGNPGGMQVSKNLSVYVEVPGQDETNMYKVGPILENITRNHSAILIDCDFDTPIEYFANAQEIYLVQSMDVLTIQPLTAFLKELKNRDALEQNKIRIIVNKAMRLRGMTTKQVVGGMSRYNNPEMSMMTELFDRNLIVPIEIPFDVDVYAKYIEALAECNVSISKYPKEFQNILKKLAAVIYPLLPAKNSKEKVQRGYQYSNGFSNNVNNTLNNMKKKY